MYSMLLNFSTDIPEIFFKKSIIVAFMILKTFAVGSIFISLLAVFNNLSADTKNELDFRQERQDGGNKLIFW